MKTSVCSFALVYSFAILSTAPGGEQRIRIEMHIAGMPENDAGTRQTLLKRKKTTSEVRKGADFTLAATAGKTFKASDFEDFIAPTSYSPPEFPEGAKSRWHHPLHFAVGERFLGIGN